jgi:methyltransferase
MKHPPQITSLTNFQAPTAAANELLTPGGEVQFVSQMITESVELQDRCQWFTSLIGKFASLKPLVDLLRGHKVKSSTRVIFQSLTSAQIENYFIKSIKPSKTTRWILGWSYGEARLPDVSMVGLTKRHG